MALLRKEDNMNQFVELLKDEKLSSELANVLQENGENGDYVSTITKFASEHGVTINDAEVKELMNKIPLPESFMDEVAGGARYVATGARGARVERSWADLINWFIQQYEELTK